LKNVTGFWLLEECRRAWAGSGGADLEPLLGAAGDAAPHAAFLDPDWPGFRSPPDMPSAIEAYLAATNQARPTSRGGVVRLILEGLALRTARVIEELDALREEPIRRVHLIGGGARNELLCQMTADATRLPVLAGPVEATAAGNLLVQASALGALSDLQEIRAISRRSFEPRLHEPGEIGDENRARFAAICESAPPVPWSPGRRQ
jgi:rhamnulokinase